MRIKLVGVTNYRCIADAEIACDSLTALVGANGAGKSTFLSAIGLFYDINPRLTDEDFYGRAVTTPIEIRITFTDLDSAEKDRFKSYTQGNDLSVVRVLTLTDSKYHGSALQNPDFKLARTAGSAADLKAFYKDLLDKYPDLPEYRNVDQAKAALKDWEGDPAHTGVCVRDRDDGQFFGFKEVGQGFLGKDTKYIFIPAVRDAAEDAEDRRGSAITELMDLVVRKTLFEREEIKKFKSDTIKKYNELVDPTRIKELATLSSDLSNTLKTYVRNAGVRVSWEPPTEISIPLPKADIKLLEDGYPSTVGHAGHGLQRAFILTMLQHLAAPQPTPVDRPTTTDSASDDRQPDLIFGIEEPEVYQHPSRQRHFANVLMKLASSGIPGVAKRSQVIYATHSPLFVGLDRFDQIRIIRKIRGAQDKPKVSTVVHRTLHDVATLIEKAYGESVPFTADALRPRLVTLMTPWISEGFFADVIVLVEGEGDRAAMVAASDALGYDLDARGISVLPCSGKSNVFAAAAIFRCFGIPTYALWDGDSHLGKSAGKCIECGHDLDHKADPRENLRLLRLLGLPEEDWPCHVKQTSASFPKKLETTMKEEIGEELFNKLLDDRREKFGMGRRRDAIKNPAVLGAILRLARKDGHCSKTLEQIVEAIVALSESAAENTAGPQD